MSPPKLTPMIKQYLSIKEEYPDAILFYRMGDFYEMFFEDAQVASRVLEITLTSRNKKDESPVPMCGVPHRAVSGYIARLIDHGYKVAVCDQIEDPATAKGLVKRDVVRVITPGMIIDDAFLDKRSNNFVLAVVHHGNLNGLAYLDISTGGFRVTESDDLDAIVDESLRIAPSEILLAESSKSDPQMASIRGALAVFNEMDCDPIYHLGDFCDSAHPETAIDCIQTLQNHRIHTIKGNYAQMFVANHHDREHISSGD